MVDPESGTAGKADEPPVSVIIPNYNYVRTLPLCIQSVRSQTYPNIEIIVVDDQSTDGSAELARSLGVRVLRTPVNGGPAAARNLGAGYARGEVLFFLDSDVVLEPEAVANAVALLRSSPRIGAICGIYRPEPLFRDAWVKEYRALQMHLWWLREQSDGVIDGLHSALFAMRADVFRDVGPFNPRLRWFEEQEYYLRLRERYEVRASSAIGGRHDHDPSTRILLAKVLDRARLGAMRWRQRGVPGASGARAVGSACVLAAAASFVLLPLLGPGGIAVPAALLCVAIALDAGTYRYVFVSRGVLFGFRFVGMHLLVNVTAAVGVAIGTVQMALRRQATHRMFETGDLTPGGGPR